MAESRNNKRKCSFCGRAESEVGFLITGLNGCICESCAMQAYEIAQEAIGGAARNKKNGNQLNLQELPTNS